MDLAVIADEGHRAAIERLLRLSRPLVEVREEAGAWVAVRSGAGSNDLNGVVSERGFVPAAGQIASLVRWFGDAPATWLARAADPALTSALVDAGFVPERTGSWCGRDVLAPVPPAEWVSRVRGSEELEEWLDVAAACGWFVDAHDRARRRDLLLAELREPARAEARPLWVARVGGSTVGMASAWHGSVCELVDLAVAETARRTGVGTALVSAVDGWAHARGAQRLVAAPSPDGWALLGAVGFEAAPVLPDVAFYVPTAWS